MGGAIRGIDPVRDQFTLQVSGGGSVKILFDERTQLFRDGVRTPMRELRTADHASVETVLDRTSVFALAIHLLSTAPEGELEGQVLSFKGSADLIIESRLSREPIRLHVPASLPISCVGQAAAASCAKLSAADLTRGALVSVKFQPDNTGGGVATEISLLATPGSVFTLTGDLVALDLHAGLLVLVDARDNSSYSISFDAARFPNTGDLREGAHLTVSAIFDGSRYVANTIALH